MAPKTKLSTSNSLAIRAGVAPSAARTASSCRRASARTSIRFAMLAQAISSTAPIAPMSTHNALATLPTKSSLKGRTSGGDSPACELFARQRAAGHGRPRVEPNRQHALDVRTRFGRRHARLQSRQHIGAEVVDHFFCRVEPQSDDHVRLRSQIEESEIPRHDADDVRRPRIDRELAPEHRFVTAEPSLPERIRKNDGSGPSAAGPYSSSVNHRPRIGCTPSARRMPSVTQRVDISSGSPRSVSVAPPRCHRPMSANVRFSSRYVRYIVGSENRSS